MKVLPSTLNFRVGDVTDSIEVLQTSCKGLNPFRSTIINCSRSPIRQEASVSKTEGCWFKSSREYQIFTSACSPTAEAAVLNIAHVKVQIFPRAFEDVGERLSRQSFKLEIAGSNPVVLTNSIWDCGLLIWDLEIRNPTSQIRNRIAGIAKRTKAAVCKTAKHRFKSDYPLQIFFRKRDEKVAITVC